MRPPETITDKLFQKADEELKAEIEKAISALSSIVTNGSRSLYAYVLKDPLTGHDVNGVGMVEQFRKLAFDGLRDQRRKRAVDEFMERFEEFSKSLEWIESQRE